MQYRSVLAAAALAAGLAAPAQAAVDFRFSFTNTLTGVEGLVEGIIAGLADTGTSPAESVTVTYSEPGFGLGDYVGGASINSVNSFTVSGGTITAFSFFSARPGCCGLILDTATFGHTIGGLTDMSGTTPLSATDLTDLSFTQVPLPAPLALLGAALAGLAGLGLRRRA